MTPFGEWFERGSGPANWIPKSKEAWVLTAVIVGFGALIGRIA